MKGSSGLPSFSRCLAAWYWTLRKTMAWMVMMEMRIGIRAGVAVQVRWRSDISLCTSTSNEKFYDDTVWKDEVALMKCNATLVVHHSS